MLQEIEDILRKAAEMPTRKFFRRRFLEFFQPLSTSIASTAPLTSVGSNINNNNNISAGGEASPVPSTKRALSSAPSSPAASAVASNPSQQHIMMSYAWAKEAKPEHVKLLTSYLQEKHGYDVWRDEDGSSICGEMAGGTDAKMAEAIEKSHTVIVCVSRGYKDSVNCQKEASYAHQLKDKGKVKLIYVMVQQEFTTVSKPDCIQGPLALWIGDALWYPLWDVGQVQGTGDKLAGLVGNNAKLVTASAVCAIPWTHLQFETRDAIGKGAFGLVFKATWLPKHPKTAGSRQVAVKVLTASAAATMGRDYTTERGRALQEAERIVQIGQRGSQILRDLILHVYGFADGQLPPNITSMFGLRDGEQAIGKLSAS